MAVLATLALAAFAAAPASAATPAAASATFVLAPVGPSASLLLRARPGDVLHGAVRVRNVSVRSISVRLQPADIQNAANGNADYVTTKLAHAGRWLHLAAANVPLEPHASRTIAFTVRVPAGITGASHYAGIVAFNAADLAARPGKTTASHTQFRFQRVTRQALPLTIRLPGRLSRSLALRSTRLVVQPIGAGLVLDLHTGGSVLIQGARVQLRVMRGEHTVFTSDSTLGQLFPGSHLSYRIPWAGRPTEGGYRVIGMISPQGAAAVRVDRTVAFTAANAHTLRTVTPPPVATHAAAQSMPIWVWLALAAGATLLSVLSFAVWRLARRRPLAPTAFDA
jgi:hypothetical protein